MGSSSGQGFEGIYRVRKKLSTKFDVGEVVVTPAASAVLEAHGQSVDELLSRHQAGDWGEVSRQVREVNERGLAERFNVQSVYPVRSGQRVIVVTKGDRSLTMVHLDVTGC
jgi:hypothetical protein